MALHTRRLYEALNKGDRIKKGKWRNYEMDYYFSNGRKKCFFYCREKIMRNGFYFQFSINTYFDRLHFIFKTDS